MSRKTPEHTADLSDGQVFARRWAVNGATCGFIAGIAVSALFLAPRIADWGIGRAAALVVGSAVVGAILGYFVTWLVIGGQVTALSGGDADGPHIDDRD